LIWRACWQKNGVAEPVLWLGDGVHDAKAKNAFAQAEVISFKSINFKRQVPPEFYAGKLPRFGRVLQCMRHVIMRSS
jgi:hypothetical protein